MVQISSPQTPPELESPSLPQAIRFFTPRQKRFLIISSAIFFVVVALSGATFYFWLTSFKNSQVDFNISGPTQVASGEIIPYIISYWNNTNQILQNAVLTIRYPQDAIISGDKTVQNIDLGNIGIGGGGKQEIKVVFTGSDKSIDKLDAILNYKPQNTSSAFENEIIKEVAINGSVLSVDFKTPEEVLSNTRGNYTIHYKNNSDKIINNVSIKIDYPSEFNFVSSDKIPSKDNNLWNLGDLNPNEEGDIIITGILRNGQNLNFNISIGVNENNKFYQFFQNSSQVGLSNVPIKLDISVNGGTGIVANPGDFLQFKINYENDASVALSDVVLKAKLDGLMYDLSTLKTNGFFNGANNTITWNAGNTPDFKSLESNKSGEVEFDISVKPLYIIRTFRDKNFLLQVSATLETPTVPSPLAVKSLLVASNLAIKVNTKAELKTKGYYYDAVVKNSGPLPPKVGKTTTYTVHWQVIDYSNDIDNALVKAVLPEGVKWLNNKSGAGAATLDYNDQTNELTWNIGSVAAGTGVLLNPYEVVFQLALTPSINKTNLVVPILGDSTLTAEDIFTGNNITVSAPSLKTDLPDDPGVGLSKSRIQP